MRRMVPLLAILLAILLVGKRAGGLAILLAILLVGKRAGGVGAVQGRAVGRHVCVLFLPSSSVLDGGLQLT